MIGTSFDGGTSIRKRHRDFSIHEDAAPCAGFSWSPSPYDDESQRSARQLPAAVEIQHADAPGLAPSTRIADTDLGPAAVAVLYPDSRRYALVERIEAVPLHTLAEPVGLFDEVAS